VATIDELLAHATLHDEAGCHVATVVQQVLVRPLRP
jgi:hypothetical protein